MLELWNHPGIEVITLAEVTDIKRDKERFAAEILKKPRYIDASKCIARGECAEVCPQEVKISSGFFCVSLGRFFTFQLSSLPVRWTQTGGKQ